MPWLSIIMAILTMLASLMRNPEKKGQALAMGALAGLGTYYVSHETEWGRDVLGGLDGVPQIPVQSGAPIQLADGSLLYPGQSSTPNLAAGGAGTATTPKSGSTSGLWSTLSSWGPTGTATVIGAGTLATSSKVQSYLPWIIGGGLILLLMR